MISKGMISKGNGSLTLLVRWGELLGSLSFILIPRQGSVTGITRME